jgi:hypothetical protein
VLHLTHSAAKGCQFLIGQTCQPLLFHSACDLSVMKSVAELGVYLAWVVVVKSSERHTVVQKDVAICRIQSSHGNAIFLRKTFPE